MLYPIDATTYLIDNYGALTPTATGIPPNSTFLHIHIQSDGGHAVVWCGDPDGGYPLAQTLGTNFDSDLQVYCDAQSYITQDGDSNSQFYALTYVPYDIAASTSTAPAIYNGFTHGEIITTIFLFLILVSSLYFKIVRATKI